MDNINNGTLEAKELEIIIRSDEESESKKAAAFEKLKELADGSDEANRDHACTILAEIYINPVLNNMLGKYAGSLNGKLAFGYASKVSENHPKYWAMLVICGELCGGCISLDMSDRAEIDYNMAIVYLESAISYTPSQNRIRIYEALNNVYSRQLIYDPENAGSTLEIMYETLVFDFEAGYYDAGAFLAAFEMDGINDIGQFDVARADYYLASVLRNGSDKAKKTALTFALINAFGKSKFDLVDATIERYLSMLERLNSDNVPALKLAYADYKNRRRKEPEPRSDFWAAYI